MLMKEFIYSHTNRKDTILGLFMGSGIIGFATLQLIENL